MKPSKRKLPFVRSINRQINADNNLLKQRKRKPVGQANQIMGSYNHQFKTKKEDKEVIVYLLREIRSLNICQANRSLVMKATLWSKIRKKRRCKRMQVKLELTLIQAERCAEQDDIVLDP